MDEPRGGRRGGEEEEEKVESPIASEGGVACLQNFAQSAKVSILRQTAELKITGERE